MNKARITMHNTHSSLIQRTRRSNSNVFSELALLSVNADRAPDEKCIRKEYSRAERVRERKKERERERERETKPVNADRAPDEK